MNARSPESNNTDEYLQNLFEGIDYVINRDDRSKGNLVDILYIVFIYIPGIANLNFSEGVLRLRAGILDFRLREGVKLPQKFLKIGFKLI